MAKRAVKRAVRWLALALSVGFAVAATALWYGVLRPWDYVAPPGLAPIEQNVKHRVFAYGTLRLPLLRRLVVGRKTPVRPAALAGFRKDGLNIVAQAGALTPGEVFVVDAEELRRIDRYERLGVRYRRCALPLVSGTTAWVYRRLDGD